MLTHPLHTPEAAPSRPGRRSGHFALLAVWRVWSSGVARGAHTHPERISSVGAYRRLASKAILRACGDSGCSSRPLMVNLGQHAKAEVSSLTIRNYTGYKTALLRCFTTTHGLPRMIFRELGAQEQCEPAKPAFMDRPYESHFFLLPHLYLVRA